MKKPVLGQRARLVKKLLLLDGISRSGKFVLANILNGLKDIEPVQYSGVVEHIPYLAKLGLMDTRAAEELLHHEIDLHCYEMLIGRNLNHRASDKSSIYNVADHETYLLRVHEEDTDKALKDFYARGAYSLFISHEALPVVDVFLKTFPDMRVVSLERSPVDLVYAWFTRYAINKWGSDAKFFPPVFKGRRGFMPWFVHDVAAEFEKTKGADRTIMMIETLFRKYEKARKKLPPAFRKKILFVRYDDTLERTDHVIDSLSRFLGKKRTADMSKILARLHLPNPDYSKGKKETRLEEIRAHASSTYFRKLLALEKAFYERS